MSATDEVIITENGRLGRITLNRPKTINAVSHAMVTAVHGALRRWQHDDRITTVVLDGAGERGFSAGGDVRALYFDAIAAGGQSYDYWRDEYRMDFALANYPKPIVALMDGIVMGAGVGLTGHCSHRLVSEEASVAMPEVTIGFMPDAGGSYLLARAPGELGTLLGLTSSRMAAGDALYCGFADAFVPLARRAELIDALTEADADSAIAGFVAEPPPSQLAVDQPWIDECFGADTVEQIRQRLIDNARPELAETLSRLSPTALKVTLRTLRLAGANLSLAACLTRELRVSMRSLTNHDFVEGIRAQIIDKDRTPQWEPASLAEVSDEAVAAFFVPLDEQDLVLADV